MWFSSVFSSLKSGGQGARTIPTTLLGITAAAYNQRSPQSIARAVSRRVRVRVHYSCLNEVHDDHLPRLSEAEPYTDYQSTDFAVRNRNRIFPSPSLVLCLGQISTMVTDLGGVASKMSSRCTGGVMIDIIGVPSPLGTPKMVCKDSPRKFSASFLFFFFLNSSRQQERLHLVDDDLSMLRSSAVISERVQTCPASWVCRWFSVGLGYRNLARLPLSTP